MATKETIRQAKYDKENCMRLRLGFDINTDSDIIEKLESLKAEGKSVAGFIKKALHDYIEEGSK